MLDHSLFDILIGQSSSNSKPNIEYAMTARANEKPFGHVAIFLEHIMEAVFIPTFGTFLKLVLHHDRFHFVIHFRPPRLMLLE